MALIVQKYGGTSLSSVEKIRWAAAHLVRTKEAGNDVVAVVSAMAGETDRLYEMCLEVMDPPDSRELDVITSSGEQVSSGLISMAVRALGHDAVSFQGHQVRILTDDSYSNARIMDIDAVRIREAMGCGKIVVVAGFQGVDSGGNITTLGRGGSDLTAVALAAVLGADACELYKDDVDGVYTADPGVVAGARKLRRVSYEEMLELSSLGSRVLQGRAVEFAKKFGVPVQIRSTIEPEREGTWVIEEQSAMVALEQMLISGVTFDNNQSKITAIKVPDRPGIASRLFTLISDEDIVVDMIVQNVSTEGYTDITFTVSRTDFKKALGITERVAGELGASGVVSDKKIAKLSIVGVGMKTHSGVASEMFRVLAAEGINILMISTSEIKISCVVEEKYSKLAVRALHEAFGLGEAK